MQWPLPDVLRSFSIWDILSFSPVGNFLCLYVVVCGVLSAHGCVCACVDSGGVKCGCGWCVCVNSGGADLSTLTIPTWDSWFQPCSHGDVLISHGLLISKFCAHAHMSVHMSIFGSQYSEGEDIAMHPSLRDRSDTEVCCLRSIRWIGVTGITGRRPAGLWWQ